MKKSFVITTALLIYPAYAFGKTARFIDSTHNVSFNVPHAWEVVEGFGETIATLKNSEGGKVSLKWLAGSQGASARDTLMSAVANEFKGARLSAVDEHASFGADTVSAGFESASLYGDTALSGEATLLPVRHGFLQVSCSAPREKYYDMYFICREFIKGIDLAKTEFGRGPSGAIALYQIGMSEGEAGTAILRFTSAIEADPLFAPAYTALARALLASGETADAVRTKIGGLLAKAPDAPALTALKKALGEIKPVEIAHVK